MTHYLENIMTEITKHKALKKKNFGWHLKVVSILFF